MLDEIFTIRRKDAGSRQDAGSRKQAGRRQALSVQRSPPPSPTHSPAAPAKLLIKPPVREQRFACDAALPAGLDLLHEGVAQVPARRAEFAAWEMVR